MKVAIKNLGAIGQAEFALGDLTIICGENNTGKTYATYALFGFLSYWDSLFHVKIPDSTISQLLSYGVVPLNLDDYINNAATIIHGACAEYAKRLPRVFASSEKRFLNSRLDVDLEGDDIQPVKQFRRDMGAAKHQLISISKEEDSHVITISLLVEKREVVMPHHVISQIIGDSLKEIVFRNSFPRPFMVSSERTGVATFRKELDFARNRLLEEISSVEKELNPFELLSKVNADYALPVKSNIDFTRQLETIINQESYIATLHPEILEEFSDIIGGDYQVSKNDGLYYTPKGKRIKLMMGESSSAVRSLLDLGFYLRHVAARGDLLMVDEPELNLHPTNQRRIARLFSRLIQVGVKVFMTTHSDYIIKELNTLIMLNQGHPRLQQLAEREGYRKDELLNADHVRVYIAEKKLINVAGKQRKGTCQTLVPADIDQKMGIEARSFDNTIDEMNRIQEEIVWGGEPSMQQIGQSTLTA